MTSDNHVQAEALAAWAEGRLPAADAATVEVHLASCASCQEMLAAFARTEPHVASGFSRITPIVSGFRWFRWRWAVPVAVAATAAAIWVAVPDNPSEDEFERTVARAIEERAATPGRSSSVDAAAPGAEPQPLSSRRDAPSATFEDRAEKRAPAAQERDQDLKAEAAEAAEPTAARAPAPAAPEEVRLRAETLTTVQRESPLEAVSPDPLVRWRIVAIARLERSTDGGRTWEPIPLPQPVDLVAVRAPTATSAIVTAADGRQFRTEDQGKTWNPVQP